MNLKNKKIILGITGSIAAYKTPMLVREFMKFGAEVRVVATPAAKEFASLMVLENLTKNPVLTEMFDNRVQGKGAWHVELAHWCDAMLIAPCSATTLSKLATGNCDNPLSCVAIALPKKKPLILAPAMDFTMYENFATQKNILTMLENGAKIIYPDEGELASGLIGKGRLPEFHTLIDATNEILNGNPANTFNNINNDFSNIEQNINKVDRKLNNSVDLSGKKILITAGATQEKIDDVRYISNYSTGKMGYALAKIATKFGAEVTLISGKTELEKPKVKNFIQIISAEEMFEAVKNNFENNEIVIMCAAVADFSPIKKFDGKIKKEKFADEYQIKFKKNPDILKWLGENNQANNSKKFIVGFALEAENEIENGRKKLQEKNCDMIVVNSATKKDSGFGGDNNTISIIKKSGEVIFYETMSKEECAEKIIEQIIN
jgi:phosphopantothenoylcysteine decarboxylase/phosphopantothenate--cysteine ligase